MRVRRGEKFKKITVGRKLKKSNCHFLFVYSTNISHIRDVFMIRCVVENSLIFLLKFCLIFPFNCDFWWFSGVLEKGRKVQKHTIGHKLKLSNWHFLSFSTSNICKSIMIFSWLFLNWKLSNCHFPFVYSKSIHIFLMFSWLNVWW